MPHRLITPPAVEPVSLSEAKLHLRQDIDDDDALITALIVAARQVCETRLKRALVTQTWELTLDAFPAADGAITVGMPPLQAVSAITYTDADGTAQTLAASAYQAFPGTPGRVVPVYGRSWPTARGDVAIRFTAGYGLASDVPACVKAAMLLLIGDWYENREVAVSGAVTDRLTTVVDLLLSPEQWGAYL